MTETTRVLPETTEAIEALVKEVAKGLNEHRPQPIEQIRSLFLLMGEAFVREQWEKALEVEAAGGLRRHDGRQRTLGGVFFRVTNDAMTEEQRKTVLWMSRTQTNRRQYAQKQKQAAASPKATAVTSPKKAPAKAAATAQASKAPQKGQTPKGKNPQKSQAPAAAQGKSQQKGQPAAPVRPRPNPAAELAAKAIDISDKLGQLEHTAMLLRQRIAAKVAQGQRASMEQTLLQTTEKQIKQIKGQAV